MAIFWAFFINSGHHSTNKSFNISCIAILQQLKPLKIYLFVYQRFGQIIHKYLGELYNIYIHGYLHQIDKSIWIDLTLLIRGEPSLLPVLFHFFEKYLILDVDAYCMSFSPAMR